MLTPRLVTVGITNGSVTEVTDGLKEGEEVVVSLTSMAEATVAPAGEKSPFMPQPPGSNRKK